MKATLTNASPNGLRSAYEYLRAQVLAGGRGPGLAIFLHHGMREWMEVCSSCAPAVAAVEPVQQTTNPQYVPPEMRSEIVSILAGLFLRNRWEANR